MEVAFRSATRTRSGKRTDGLFAAADLASSAGHVRRREAELTVHVGSGDAQRQQTVRLKRHAHLAGDTTYSLDAADALHALKRAGDVVLDKPGEIGRRHGRSFDGVNQDR